MKSSTKSICYKHFCQKLHQNVSIHSKTFGKTYKKYSKSVTEYLVRKIYDDEISNKK